MGCKRLEIGVLRAGGGVEEAAEMQVEAENQRDGGADRERQGPAPSPLRRPGRAAQDREQEQQVHQRERGKAVFADRLDLEDRHQGQEPAYAEADAGDEKQEPPCRRPGAQAPRQTGEKRVGEQAPERHRQAQQGGPAARLHDVALRLRPAPGRMLAEPGDQRQIAGEQDAGCRQAENPVVERMLPAGRRSGPCWGMPRRAGVAAGAGARSFALPGHRRASRLSVRSAPREGRGSG